MENQSQKWVNLCYAAAAFLLGFIVSSFCMKLAGVYDLETKIRNIEIIIRIASIISGVVLFVVLYRNVEVNQFMNEVVTELFRVTWPTQKETSSATVVVIIMVIISGLLLGLLDYTWTAVVKLIF